MLSPRGHISTNSSSNLQSLSTSSLLSHNIESNQNGFENWSSSASSSSSSSKKHVESLNASPPSTSSSPLGANQSPPVFSMNSNASQFFVPTTSSSPLNPQQQQQSFGQLMPDNISNQSYQQQQQLPSNGTYWSSLNMSSNSYHSSYLNQHNYALAALAANYHPQLSISPLGHLNQNYSAGLQFNGTSNNSSINGQTSPSQFYESNGQANLFNQLAAAAASSSYLSTTTKATTSNPIVDIDTSVNHNDSGFESPKATNVESKLAGVVANAQETSNLMANKQETNDLNRRPVWSSSIC